MNITRFIGFLEMPAG